MAAIFRVKRKAEENPVQSFIVSCKRIKSDTNESNSFKKTAEIKGHFKFAATIQEKDQATKFVRNAVQKEKQQKELKQHSFESHSSSGVLEKSRSGQKLKYISNRFKVVSKKRAGKFDDLDDQLNSDAVSDECSRLYQLYDIVADGNDVSSKQAESSPTNQSESEVLTCNNVPMVREKVEPSADYVYDLYYLNKSDFDYRALENILAIEAMKEEDEYVYDEYRDKVDEVYGEEEDENDENNWRNDYPDEEPHFYEKDDYELGCYSAGDDWGTSSVLRERLTFMDGRSDEEVYSSADEDDLQHKNTDLWNPTTSYETYKKRILKELNLDDT